MESAASSGLGVKGCHQTDLISLTTQPVFKTDSVGAVQFHNLQQMYAEYKSKFSDLPFEECYRKELVEKFACQHLNKKHCAKFMCKSCYHQKGNSKSASGCGHPERSHYSQGMCKSCYHKKYYVKSKRIQKTKTQTKSKIKK